MGDAATAGDPVTTGTGGIWKRIKDKEVVISAALTDSETIRDTLYGTDSTNGSAGTILETVIALNTSIDAKSTNVDTKSATVDTQYIDLVGADGLGGKIAQFNTDLTTLDVTKMQLVADSIADVNTVAGVSTEVVSLAADKTTLDSLYADKTNLDAVAANKVNIDAVAANKSNIDAAVSNESNINAAVTAASSITAIVANEANITTVASNEANINAVAGDLANIDTAVANLTNINLVATNATNITAVASNEANIDIVAAGKTNIDFVAANVANIDIVGFNATNINTVASIESSIVSIVADKTKLDSIYTDKGTLDSIYADKATIDAVAGIATEIAAVDTNSTSITLVGTDLNAGVNSDVITVADDLQDVNSVLKAVSANIQSGTSSINDAEANATTALSSAAAALASELKAADWAEKLTEVEAGKNSAKYWAGEAAAIVGGGIINDDVVNTTTTYSSYKIDALNSAQTDLISGLATAQAKIAGTGNPVIASLTTTQVIVPITTSVATTDATILNVDDGNNLLTFHKDATYSIFSKVLVSSSTDSTVTAIIKYIDNSNSSVLTTDSIVVNIGSGKTESYDLNNLLTVGKNGIPSGPLNIRTEIVADIPGLEITSVDSIIASSSSYELESKAENVSVTPSGAMTDTTVQDGLVTLANSTSEVADVYLATGVTGGNKRYDKILENLDLIETKRTSGIITAFRYEGDANTVAPYYRDVLTRSGTDLTLVEHFHNTGDLITPSGTTTMVYSSGDLVSSVYSEA